jgi:hypothetical protein
MTEFDPAVLARIATLPGVRSAKTVAVPNVLPVPSSEEVTVAPAQDVIFVGNVDGLLFTQDRLTAIKGRLADPKRADEAVLTPQAADELGVDVAGTLSLGVFTSAQANDPGYRSACPAQSTRRW